MSLLLPLPGDQGWMRMTNGRGAGRKPTSFNAGTESPVLLSFGTHRATSKAYATAVKSGSWRINGFAWYG